MKKQLVILGIAVPLLAVGLSGCVGGPCSYDTYNGMATITSVKLFENLTEDVEDASGRYQVLFIFELNDNESIKQEQISLRLRLLPSVLIH